MSTKQILAPKGDEKEETMSPNIGESNPDESNDIPMNEVDDGTKSSTWNGHSRKLTSVVWNHFDRKLIGGEWKVVCKYCRGKLLDDILAWPLEVLQTSNNTRHQTSTSEN